VSRGEGLVKALLGLHVLVVDDDHDARELLESVLTYCGAFVTLAASAREGVEAFRRHVPDAVVSDIAMPGEDGYWLVAQLHGLTGDAPRVPVVALTAFGREHGPDRALSAGFQAHLCKPVDPWELCRLLARLARKA